VPTSVAWRMVVPEAERLAKWPAPGDDLDQKESLFRLSSWLGRGANSVGVSPAKARVWSPGVVVDAPGFDALAGLGETDEQVLVEALAQPAVEGLDETILRRLTRRHGVRRLHGRGRHRRGHRARDVLDIGLREMRVHRQ
jgi:hypothetical protein